MVRQLPLRNPKAIWLTLLLAIGFIVTPPVNAQRPDLLVHLAGSYTCFNGNLSTSGISEVDYRWGSRLGLGCEIPVGELPNLNSSVQTYIVYAIKGFRATFDGLGIKGRGRTVLHTLEVPFLYNLSYTYLLPVLIFANAGPYIGLGLASRQIFNAAEEESQGAAVNLYQTEGGLKRLEVGLQIGAGVEWNRLQLALNYQFGLLNQAQQPQQRYLAQGGIISLGIRF